MSDELPANRRSHLHDDERWWVIGALAAMIAMVLALGVLAYCWHASGKNFTTDLRAQGEQG